MRSRYNKSLCEESKGLKWGLSVQISLGQNSQKVAAPSFPNSLSYPTLSKTYKQTSKLAKNNKSSSFCVILFLDCGLQWYVQIFSCVFKEERVVLKPCSCIVLTS